MYSTEYSTMECVVYCNVLFLPDGPHLGKRNLKKATNLFIIFYSFVILISQAVSHFRERKRSDLQHDQIFSARLHMTTSNITQPYLQGIPCYQLHSINPTSNDGGVLVSNSTSKPL